jgi:hypothetical protein
MLHEQTALLPHAWVSGDDEMGSCAWFRQQLRARRERYLLAVPSNTSIRDWTVVEPNRRTPSKAQHRVEECLQRAKGEAGLADYEVRTWRGWYHHPVLALTATWFLTVEARRGKEMDTGVDRGQARPSAGRGLSRNEPVPGVPPSPSRVMKVYGRLLTEEFPGTDSRRCARSRSGSRRPQASCAGS